MATLTLDIPDTNVINLSLLKFQLQKIVDAMISIPNCIETEKHHDDIHIFDCLHDDWGGDRDPNEIADELRNSRINDWNVEPW
ncbi:MAG: hypothetical protein MJZ61_01515 [Bacteroidales bacterium]|nr:hypothetical protein [Bacteroidales bacterium]